jgi:hypothetical protein
MKHIVVRHDIVRRGGKTKHGSAVLITAERLNQLRGDVVAFVGEIEPSLQKRFPATSSPGLGQVDDF